MLLRRKIIAEKKKEKEKEEKEKEENSGGAERKKAEAVNLDDLSELEQKLFDAQKDCLVQKRKAFNAESQLEEKDLEIALLVAEVKKLKRD